MKTSKYVLIVFFIQSLKTSFNLPPGITLQITGIGAIIWKNISLTTRTAISKQKFNNTYNKNTPATVEINTL